MRPRALAAITFSSALVTLDGTMVTIALPAIGSALDAPISTLQWITGASLLAMAALLLIGGAVADRIGRRRTIVIGLTLFGGGAVAAAVSQEAGWLIAARLAQGAGAAMLLPATVATLRARVTDQRQRTRAFGTWAAGTGLAAAIGPLLGGGLVDAMSWRAVFGLAAVLAAVALLLIRSVPETHNGESQAEYRPAAMLAVIGVFGAVAYLLIEGPGLGWRSPGAVTALAVACGSALLLTRTRGEILLPIEVRSSRTCKAANAATFALYFGMFGFSFLIVLYTQMVLGYSATWAGISVMPMAVLLLTSERFGRLATRGHTRPLLLLGPLAAGAAVTWVAFAPHPLPFWTHIVPGAAVFGLGLAMTLSPLTEAALGSVPDTCAGAASGVHHMTVRAAGLAAVAVLGYTASSADGRLISVDAFRLALGACALVTAAAAPIALWLMRDEPGTNTIFQAA